MLAVVLSATPGWGSDSDFLIAEKLYRAKESSQAEQLYAQFEPGNANYPVAQLRLGTIYYLTGRPDQAENRFAIFLKFGKTLEACCLLAGAQFN
jgi:hypothetical protein